MLINTKKLIQVILLYYLIGSAEAEVLFITWTEPLGQIDGYRLYESPDKLVSSLPKSVVGLNIKYEPSDGIEFVLKSYTGDQESIISSFKPSMEYSQSICLPGISNLVSNYQKLAEDLNKEIEKNNIISDLSNYIKIEECTQKRIDITNTLNNEINSLQDSMNRLVNSNDELYEKNNALERLQNILLDKQKKLEQNQNLLEIENKNFNSELISTKLKLYHPNGELWKQHWCASRETVCNIEDAFAGFKICRYPYIPECEFLSYHP